MSDNLPVLSDDARNALARLGGDDNDSMIGLEQFGADDFIMPRLNINHETAQFEDNLSGETYPEGLEVVVLGLIKQRILWHYDPDAADFPLCKSYDFVHGFPAEKDYPWELSGFPRDTPTPLDCASCQLKEWNSHPQRDTPYCSEQHALPVMQNLPEVGWIPALVTLQRSGIKPSKSYLSGFVRTRTPLFTALTTITLDPRKKGSVVYAVPQFKKGAATAPDDYATFVDAWKRIHAFITTPPSSSGSGGDDDAAVEPAAPRNTRPAASEPVSAAPASAPPAAGPTTLAPTGPAPVPAAPAPAPTPAADDDDIPF